MDTDKDKLISKKELETWVAGKQQIIQGQYQKKLSKAIVELDK